MYFVQTQCDLSIPIVAILIPVGIATVVNHVIRD